MALASGFASGAGHAGVITLQNATATVLQDEFVVGQSIDGNSVSSFNGWAIGNGETNQTAVWETLADFGFASGTLLTITLFQNQGDFHTLGDFRISLTTDDRATFADGLPAGGDVSANWTILAPFSATSTNGATLTIRGDGSILAGGTNPETAVYTINALTDLVGITGLRLEAIEDPSLITEGPNGSGPGRQPTNGNFVLTEITLDATAIPEPVTLGLLGVGLAGLGFWRRRQ